MAKKWSLIDFEINRHKLTLELGKNNTAPQI